jgi:hypothetical protein
MLCRAAGALTGLAFTGCGLVSPVLAQQPQRRREVVVNGKRVRTVDVHAHCHIPEANALMGLKVQLPSLVISPERTKVMDEQGIDIEALSCSALAQNGWNFRFESSSPLTLPPTRAPRKPSFYSASNSNRPGRISYPAFFDAGPFSPFQPQNPQAPRPARSLAL